MPGPVSKSKSANGATKSAKVTPANTVPSSPAPSKTDLSETAVPSSGKPDKAAYDAEQARIKGEIDDLQSKLAAVREKISSATKSDSGNNRRTTLKAELDSIRDQQSSNKFSRGKTLDQLKAIQDGMQKKIKDLQAARSKAPFKTAAEVDTHIKNLEKQVESGSMKIVDEKRTLQAIEQARRTRKVVEKFQADQESIEADRRAADELRKLLDDPESKEISERYDAIKAELDELKKEADEAYAGRSKLFEQRDGLQAQINALFNEKRESANRFREINDRYWTKINEDRARRAEKARAQRAADEAQKKLALAERLREEASVPAFQTEIEDCQTLIDALSGKPNGSAAPSSSSVAAKQDVLGVPQLEIRQVEAVGDTMVARKKKGEDEESYFVGKAKKGKKGPKTTATPPTDTNAVNLPFGQLSALLSLSIPPPMAQSDIPRVIEDLKTKKAWFEANQARQTAGNIAKAETEIQRLTNGTKADGKRSAIPNDIPPSNDDNGEPPESNAISEAVGDVDEKVEDDAEN